MIHRLNLRNATIMTPDYYDSWARSGQFLDNSDNLYGLHHSSYLKCKQ